jgi:WD40 repeat protein
MTLSATARAEVSFMRDIAPVLVRRCTACHGERKDSGDYRLHTFESLMRRGASDDTPIVPGKPGSSLLYKLITEKEADDRMPQKDDPLSAQQIELVRQWIKDGAKFDGADAAVPIKSLMGPRQHPLPPAAYRIPVAIMAVAFSPDGKELAAGGYHEVNIWEPTSGKLLRRLQHLPQRIQAAVYSKEGGQLLIAGGTPGDYGELALADPAGQRPPKVLDTFDDIVLSAVFSPDGKRIAAGGADQSVRVYDRESGKRLWTMKLHGDWVTAVAFSADGRFVASSSKDMNVKVYDAGSGALFTSYTGHHRQVGPYAGASPVYDVVFAPDAAMAASAGGGKWIQLWEPEKARQESGTAAELEDRFSKQGHTRYVEHGFKGDVYRLLLRPGQLFAAGADGKVKQFDPATLKEARTFSAQGDWVFALDCDSAAGRLASGSADGVVHVWEIGSGKSVAEFYAAPGYTPAISESAAVR